MVPALHDTMPPGAVRPRTRIPLLKRFSLTRPTSRALPYALACCIGLAAALWLIPLRTILAWKSFDHPFDSDYSQHITGERYFLASPWHADLLRVPAIVWPAGTNIALTDSIPLVALPLKLVAHWLPAGFHGIFLWLALCYLLQPAAAIFALRGTGEKRFWPAAAIAILAMSMPILWFRVIHSALSGQFLILIALGLYLRLCGAEPRRLHAFLAAALLPLTLLVHPYLLVMVAAVILATPVSLAIRRDIAWRFTAVTIGAGLLVTAAMAYALGYTKAVPFPSENEFSMNLLSPIYPDISSLFPNSVLPYGDWGQVDGYNYLGLGVILLACIGLATLLNRRGLRLLQRHAGLAACCAALTLLALSHRCFAGRTLLYDLGKMPEIIEQFRGCGRFFWPVAYIAAVAGVAAASTALRRRIAIPVLLAACILQFADASQLRNHARATVRAQRNWILDPLLLRPILAHERLLRVFPIVGCGGDYFGDPTYREIFQLASEHAVPINTFYVARYEHPPACDNTGSTPLEPGELRAYFRNATALPPEKARFCRRYTNILFCTRDEADLANIEKAAQPPSLALGTPAALGSKASRPMLQDGWCDPDPGGVWTCASEATLTARLQTPKATSLILSGLAITPATNQPQSVEIALNGKVLKNIDLNDRVGFRLVLPLPPDMDLSGPITLNIKIAHPTEPAQRGINSDTRTLGLWLSTIEFDGAR